MNQAPFEIGDEVVCVDTKDFVYAGNPASKVLVKDKKYKITGVEKSCCGWNVSVGIKTISMCRKCESCKEVTPIIPGNERMFRSTRFRKIEHEYKDATADILEKFKPFEGVETDQPIKIKELETQN